MSDLPDGIEETLVAGEFDDFVDDPEDGVLLEQYAADLKAAVEAFGVPILEAGEVREDTTKTIKVDATLETELG